MRVILCFFSSSSGRLEKTKEKKKECLQEMFPKLDLYRDLNELKIVSHFLHDEKRNGCFSV